MSKRAIVAALALLAALAVVAPPAQAGTVLGGETPQAVFARLVKAADKGDFGEMVACMEPESRADATMGILMGATMMVAFMDMGSGMAGAMAEGVSEATGEEMKPEDKAKLAKQKEQAAAKIKEAKDSLSKILKKYGLPDLMDPNTPAPKEGSAKEMLAKVDQPALAADLTRFLDQFGDKGEKGEQGGKGEPKEAAGKAQMPHEATDYVITGDHATAKAGGETMEFVKIDGRWFIKEPKKAPEQEQTGKAPEN